MAVNVGVDNADGQPLRGERGGEVDRHRALAHAALARGDREDAGARVGVCKRDLRAGLLAAQFLGELAALLVAHGVQRDVDLADAVELLEHGARVGLDGVAHGAAGDGEVDADGDVGTVDSHGFDHAELGDRFANFRVLDASERLVHRGFCNGRRSSHNSPSIGWCVGLSPPRPAVGAREVQWWFCRDP